MLRPSVDGHVITNLRRYEPLACLLVGTSTGGFLLGLVAIMGSMIVSTSAPMRFAVLIAGTTVAGASILWPGLRRWLPERACQVDKGRVTQGRSLAAFGWGIELGVGVRTLIATPAFYALLGIAVAQRSPSQALFVCLAYGFARGSTIVWAAVLDAIRERRGQASRRPLNGALERSMRVPTLAAIVLAAVFAWHS